MNTMFHSYEKKQSGNIHKNFPLVLNLRNHTWFLYYIVMLKMTWPVSCSLDQPLKSDSDVSYITPSTSIQLFFHLKHFER